MLVLFLTTSFLFIVEEALSVVGFGLPLLISFLFPSAFYLEIKHLFFATLFAGFFAEVFSLLPSGRAFISYAFFALLLKFIFSKFIREAKFGSVLAIAIIARVALDALNVLIIEAFIGRAPISFYAENFIKRNLPFFLLDIVTLVSMFYLFQYVFKKFKDKRLTHRA